MCCVSVISAASDDVINNTVSEVDSSDEVLSINNDEQASGVDQSSSASSAQENVVNGQTLDDDIDLNDLNDGTYTNKSINGVDGIFKSSEVTTSTGFVKNSHPRYYFNYIEDNNLVMVQCDNLKTLEGMFS